MCQSIISTCFHLLLMCEYAVQKITIKISYVYIHILLVHDIIYIDQNKMKNGYV